MWDPVVGTLESLILFGRKGMRPPRMVQQGGRAARWQGKDRWSRDPVVRVGLKQQGLVTIGCGGLEDKERWKKTISRLRSL